jgi:predicted nucleotidyltransferase
MTMGHAQHHSPYVPEKPLTEYRFFKTLVSRPFVEAVYLFGSRARGQSRDNSDIDLGVLCHRATDAEWDELKSMVKGNQELLVKVDIARLDRKTEQPFLSHVIRDRALLYIRPDYVSENNCLEDKLHFIHEWDGKMLGWANELHKHIHNVSEPSAEQLNQAYASFHYAFDSAWNLFRKCLVLHGMHTNTPLSTFRESCIEGWISPRGTWEAMVEDYAQTRGEQLIEARRLAYARLPAYVAALRAASQTLRSLVSPYEQQGRRG